MIAIKKNDMYVPPRNLPKNLEYLKLFFNAAIIVDIITKIKNPIIKNSKILFIGALNRSNF